MLVRQPEFFVVGDNYAGVSVNLVAHSSKSLGEEKVFAKVSAFNSTFNEPCPILALVGVGSFLNFKEN